MCIRKLCGLDFFSTNKVKHPIVAINFWLDLKVAEITNIEYEDSGASYSYASFYTSEICENVYAKHVFCFGYSLQFSVLVFVELLYLFKI